MNVAYLYVLPVDERPGLKVFRLRRRLEKIFAGGGPWIAALVMLSTFGTTNRHHHGDSPGLLLDGAHECLPRFIGNVHPRFHAGRVAQSGSVWSVALLFSSALRHPDRCYAHLP